QRERVERQRVQEAEEANQEGDLQKEDNHGAFFGSRGGRDQPLRPSL
ncbi:MAG: hypothetical protein GY696_05225, partial [Gammaproteobacteria bacterium]|nr:hypothetical protein [Gammaproteobacteria bacterium]